MKIIRQTPQAINRPLLLFGISKDLLCMLFVACGIVANRFSRPLAITLFIGGFIGAKMLTKRDPKAAEIWRTRLKMKARYDAFVRVPYKMEIGE